MLRTREGKRGGGPFKSLGRQGANASVASGAGGTVAPRRHGSSGAGSTASASVLRTACLKACLRARGPTAQVRRCRNGQLQTTTDAAGAPGASHRSGRWRGSRPSVGVAVRATIGGNGQEPH